MEVVQLVRNGRSEETFAIAEAPDPEPGSGEVLIDVEAFGLNFADVMARLGLYPDCPRLPAVLGYEVVGRVAGTGGGVEGLSDGQRVVAFTRFGGYATRAVTDARGVVPIGEDVDPGIAVALPTQCGTAYYCAEEMVRLHEGDNVLVQAAAGGVGTALVQLAKHRGAVVYGTAGSAAKLDYLRDIGVDHPINYREQDFAAEIRRRSPEGIDVVFDSLGGTTFRKSLSLLGPGGRIVAFGGAENAGSSPFRMFRSLRFAASFGFAHPISLLVRSRGVIGVNMLRIADGKPNILSRVLANVVGLHAEGVLAPTVGGRFPAERIAAAHALLEGRDSTGKIVVTW